MSASEPRASSGVRNLRSIFENKQSSADAASSGSPTPRGRSPFGSFDQNPGLRQTSTVRSSFISVEPHTRMATVAGGVDGAMDAVGEAKPSAALLAVNGDEKVVDQPPAHPDKPVMGAEVDVAAMAPADIASKAAISGGDALPPKVEDLRSSKTSTTKAVSNTSAAKPTAVTSKSVPKATAATAKPTASQSKPSTSTTKPETSGAKSILTSKSSRSSLTAPTAASMARAGAAAEKPKVSPAPRSKPKEVTKPVNLPSHLTAPTAASRARHELAKESVASSTGSRVKPPASTAPARSSPRTSLVPRRRTDSQSSETSTHRRKPTVPASGSFLERMTKPTAASQNRHQDKPEPRSPPRSKAVAPTHKPKANGKLIKQTTPAPDTSAAPAEVDKDEKPVQDTKAEVSPTTEAPQDESDLPATEMQAETDSPAELQEQSDAAQPVEDAKAEPPAEETADTSEPAQPLQAVEIPVEQEDEPHVPPADDATKSTLQTSDLSETKTTGSETPQHHQLPNGDGPTLESTPATLDADETIR